jgi:benzil reductase ((S)-benzoin forming)
MDMNCYIITGASRGLGLALAQAVVARGDHLVALARRESDALAQLGAEAPNYRFIALDLSDLPSTSAMADELFGSLAAFDWRKLVLINNAGTVEPIGLVPDYSDEALTDSMAVNLLAPIALCNAFVRHLHAHAGEKAILNISSGAARNPYAGWSAYCTTKAGLDMYSQCLGLEQLGRPNGTRVASVAPGVLDTDMQAVIRRQSSEAFPTVDRFRQRHVEGGLVAPREAALKLLALVDSEHFGYGSVLDLRELDS